MLLHRNGSAVSASCGGGGGIQLGVEGGFKSGVGEEGPGIGNEAGSLGDGDREWSVRVGSV